MDCGESEKAKAPLLAGQRVKGEILYHTPKFTGHFALYCY